MSKLSNLDWWLGRTPAQLARRGRIEARAQAVRDAGQSMQRVGMTLTLCVTIPIVVLVLTFPLGLVLGPLSAWGIWTLRRRKDGR